MSSLNSEASTPSAEQPPAQTQAQYWSLESNHQIHCKSAMHARRLYSVQNTNIQIHKYTNPQIHKYRNRHCSAVCRLYSVQKERDRLPPTPLPGKHDTKPLRSSKAANLFLGGFLYDGGTSQRKELLGQLIKPHAFPLLSHLQVHLN